MSKFQVSPSKLFVGSCPRALKKYVSRETPNSAYAEFTQFGTQFHNMMDFIVSNYEDTDDLESLIDAAFTEHAKEGELELRKQILKALEVIPIEKAIATELELGLTKDLTPTSFEEGYYHGRLDIVIRHSEDEIWIVDYKTSFKVYNPDSLQVKYYAWLLHKTYPDILNIRVGLYFSRYGELRLSKVIDVDEMANIERLIISKAAQLELNMDKEEPIPGAYCTYCNWVADCPVAQSQFITTEEEAKRAAAELLKIQAIEKDLKQKLQRWVDYYGPVQINEEQELTYKKKTQEAINIEKDEIPKLLKEFPDLIDYVSIPVYQLKKKKHPVLEKYGVKTKRVYTVFDVNKTKTGVVN